MKKRQKLRTSSQHKVKQRKLLEELWPEVEKHFTRLVDDMLSKKMQNMHAEFSKLALSLSRSANSKGLDTFSNTMKMEYHQPYDNGRAGYAISSNHALSFVANEVKRVMLRHF